MLVLRRVVVLVGCAPWLALTHVARAQIPIFPPTSSAGSPESESESGSGSGSGSESGLGAGSGSGSESGSGAGLGAGAGSGALPASGVPPAAVPPAKSYRLAPPRLVAVPSEDDDGDDEDGLEPRRRWYGWQLLIADGSSTGLLFTAAALDAGDSESVVVGTALLGYEFAPAVLHFVHGNPGRAFASMGVRLGLPLAGAYVGASAYSGCEGFLCEAEGAGIGVLLGMGAAIAIDTAVFAYDDASEPRMLPVLRLAPHQAWLGVAGSL